MANQLNELTDPVLEEGRDVNVINKTIKVTVGMESIIYEIGIWVLPILIGLGVGFVLKAEYGIVALVIGGLLGLIPGISYYFAKVRAGNYLLQLEQRLQHDASQIDNYLEQRVMILKNAAKLLDKAIDLDKSTFTQIAALRSGTMITDTNRNEVASTIERASRSINIAVENYPDLKAHQEIEDAMQQNAYLQKEITAAREVYNDTVLTWNRVIFSWPTKKIVAARNGYTTRIPFATTKEIKAQARDVFF